MILFGREKVRGAGRKGNGLAGQKRRGWFRLGPVHGTATGSDGFTLVEILVAVFIFSIVISALYGAYSSTFRLVGSTQKQADVYQMARIAMERISEDLEAAAPPRWQGEGMEEESHSLLGVDGQEDGKEADSLRFWSRAHLSFSGSGPRGGLSVISYAVQGAEDGKTLALYRVDVPEQEQGERERGFLLCNGLVGVNFTYFDREGELFDSWDSTSESLQGEFPASVAVELDFLVPDSDAKVIKFRTAVILPSRGNRKKD